MFRDQGLGFLGKYSLRLFVSTPAIKNEGLNRRRQIQVVQLNADLCVKISLQENRANCRSRSRLVGMSKVWKNSGLQENLCETAPYTKKMTKAA